MRDADLLESVATPPGPGPGGPDRDAWQRIVRFRLFERWAELRTDRIFQLHRLTDEACRVLETTDFAPRADAVKAVIVELVDRKGGRDGYIPVAITIKWPAAETTNRPEGLLVHEFGDRARDADAVTRPAPAPGPRGPYMTREVRVLSMTPLELRPCRSVSFNGAAAWGVYDLMHPEGRFDPPGEDVEALVHLVPGGTQAR